MGTHLAVRPFRIARSSPFVAAAVFLGCLAVGAVIVLAAARPVQAIEFVPDLYVSQLVGPSSVFEGTTVDITNVVSNGGWVLALQSTVEFYLSTDTSITAADIYLGERLVAPLPGPGGSDSAVTSLAIDGSGVPEGTYYLGAIADAHGEVSEGSGEGNNTRSYYPFTVSYRPDLRAVSLTAPAVAHRGDTVSVSDQVGNEDFGGAVPSALKYYVSLDPAITASDIYVGGRTLPFLARGASSAASSVVTIPTWLAAGDYYLGYLADADGALAESMENNNWLSSPITVHNPPQTTSVSVSGPSSVTYGSAARLVATSKLGTWSETAPPDWMGTVVLESRPSGSVTWTAVATLPAGVFGIASQTVRPLVHTYYRGRRVADYDHLEGVSPEVLVSVKFAVAMKVSASRLAVGRYVRFYGTVAPKSDCAGQWAELERWNGRRWVLVKGVKLSSTGAFSVRWRERTRGTRKFRLNMRARTYLQGYSRTKAVRWG